MVELSALGQIMGLPWAFETRPSAIQTYKQQRQVLYIEVVIFRNHSQQSGLGRPLLSAVL